MRSLEQSWKNAKRILRDNKYAISRYQNLLHKIIYFIDKINIKLDEVEVGSKKLDDYVISLSRLLKVKSELMKEIKSLEKTTKSGEKSAGDLARS